MTGIVIRYRGRPLTRREVRANAATTYYMLDDTLLGNNRGPLAEFNVIRIPTKYRVDRIEQAYFTESTMQDDRVLNKIHLAFVEARRLLNDGYDVVVPSNLGNSGNLQSRCPLLYEYLLELVQQLEESVRC